MMKNSLKVEIICKYEKSACDLILLKNDLKFKNLILNYY